MTAYNLVSWRAVVPGPVSVCHVGGAAHPAPLGGPLRQVDLALLSAMTTYTLILGRKETGDRGRHDTAQSCHPANRIGGEELTGQVCVMS